MGNATLEIGDFSAGIYRGRNAPANAAYDALNALINDEGQLFKRGGSAFKSNANAGTSLVGLADLLLIQKGGTTQRSSTAFWSSSKIYALQYTDDATPVDVTPLIATPSTFAAPPRAFARGAGVGRLWFAPSSAGGPTLLEFSFGSATVPDVNQRTLTNPPKIGFVTAVGSPARLILTNGNDAWFSDLGAPTTIQSTSFHTLVPEAQIIGADSLGNTAVLFTTNGVYAIYNLELAPVDDFGNVQQSVGRVSDLLLWGDPGIAKYADRLVVPAIDDVWLFAPGVAPVSISGDSNNEKIRPLYRSYVNAGYQPGIAAVHRGHYFLPIVNGTTLVDVLVCRLDRGAAWTRWSGHAASAAYAVRIGAATRSPKLWGINAQRVTDLTTTLDGPGTNSTDADGTTPTFQVDTTDLDTGPGPRPATTEKVRVVYEAAGASPSTSLSWSIGPEGSSYSAGTVLRGGGASDGTSYSAFRIGKKADRIRFRFSCASTVTSLILHDLQAIIRQQGGV